MIKKFLLAIAALVSLWAFTAPAAAQTCPTVSPASTADNRCASTTFVQNAIGASAATIVVGTTPITGGTNGRVLYDNAGFLGEYPVTGTAGFAVLSNQPSLTVPTLSSPILTGTVSGNNTIPLTILQQSAADTMLGNWTSGAANVLANTMPSCPDSGGNHLNYVSGTGITCGTGLGTGITALTGDVTATGPGSVPATLATVNSNVGSFGSSTSIPTFTVNAKGLITAASGNVVIAPAGTLTGATLAANVLASSLTSVGTLASLTVSGASVLQGTLTAASLSTVGSIAGSLCATSGGLVLYEVGINCFAAAAASITVGTTAVASCGTALGVLFNNASVLGCEAPSSMVFGTGTLSLSGNMTTTGAFNPTFAIPASVTYTFPGAAANLAALNIASQTLSGGANVTSSNQGTKSSGTYTVDCGVSPLQYIVNGGAFTLAAPANDGSCMVYVLNNGSAGVITPSGFTVSVNTGDAFTTTNTSKFTVTIWRINSVASYVVKALQ